MKAMKVVIDTNVFVSGIFFTESEFRSSSGRNYLQTANSIEMINMAVGLMVKSVVLAAQFSGRCRKRSLKRLSKMNADEKDKEILFLRGRTKRVRHLSLNICYKLIQ